MISLLRRWFFSGLLVWAPLGVTLLVIRFLINLLDASLLLVPTRLQPQWFDYPGIGAILTLAIVLGTGALTANLLGKKAWAAAEQWLHRLPLVGSVYGSMKKVAETMLSGKGNAFKKVVLLEYPRAGCWTVGFMTADPTPGLQAATGSDDLVAVYVPTTPNPTSGFLLLLPRKEVRELPISVQDGMQYVISLGVVPPGSSAGRIPPTAT